MLGQLIHAHPGLAAASRVALPSVTKESIPTAELLMLVSVGVVAASRSSVDVVTTTRARSVARYAAESGVIAATARLQQLLRRAETVEQQARVFQRLDQELAEMRERRIGQAWFQVSMLDLNSRLDLNASDERVLRAFFEGLFGERRGSELLDALQDGEVRANPFGAV